MRWIVSMVSFISLVFCAAGVQPRQNRCAQIEVTPPNPIYEVYPGDQVGVFMRLTNCGTKATRFEITLSVTECGLTTEINDNYATVDPDQAALFGVQYQVPACSGAYTFTARALVGNTIYATATANMTVE